MRPLLVCAILLAGCVGPDTYMRGPIHIELSRHSGGYDAHYYKGAIELTRAQPVDAVSSDSLAHEQARRAVVGERAGRITAIIGAATVLASFTAGVAAFAAQRGHSLPDGAIDGLVGSVFGGGLGITLPGAISRDASARKLEDAVRLFNRDEGAAP